jgi:dephospho-CoA kinase
MQRSTSLPKRLGLTGGIGSGKSTVARMLADRGAVVVDADAISRALTAAGGAAMPAIAETFGAAFVAADGGLNRDAMRQLVFTQPAARQQLEAIVHPLITQETRRQTDLAQSAQASCIVFDVPLLVESGRWRQQLHAVLVVDCTAEMQIARVMARSGWTREAVHKVLDAQATRARRLAAADMCIYNETASLDELAVLVGQAGRRFGL